VDAYGPSLLRVARLYVSSRAIAEEVVQETWLAVLTGIERFEGRSSLKTWLFRILTNKAKTRGQRERRTVPVSALAADGDEDQTAVDIDRFARGGEWSLPPRGVPEERLLAGEARETVETAIAALPPNQCAVITLRDVEGLSAAEVAEVMGLSVEAVKSRLHRARTAVRERIAPLLGPTLPLATPARPGPGCQDVVELFSRRLEGEIDAGACAELEEHLQECASCRGRCESLRTTLALCKQAGTAAAVPAHVEKSVRDALRRFLDSQP
jgi:RNA polymerase sigma-70 factor (ECF subfamily)